LPFTDAEAEEAEDGAAAEAADEDDDDAEAEAVDAASAAEVGSAPMPLLKGRWDGMLVSDTHREYSACACEYAVSAAT
jgi:hypothetical protein